MWDVLKQTDIAQAKQQLRLRVDETLKRHAEEIKSLDGDQVQLQTLNRLLDDFSSRFKIAPAPPNAPAEPAAEIEADEAPAEIEADEAPAEIEADEPAAEIVADEPAASTSNAVTSNTADKPSAKVRQLDQRDRDNGQRDQVRTNFDAFTRAMEKAERGG